MLNRLSNDEREKHAAACAKIYDLTEKLAEEREIPSVEYALASAMALHICKTHENPTNEEAMLDTLCIHAGIVNTLRQNFIDVINSETM